MDDVYENIDDYKPSKKRKNLVVFDHMISDIMTNKKFQAIIKDYLLGPQKWIFHSCLSHCLIFSVPKDVRLNSAHYFDYEN